MIETLDKNETETFDAREAAETLHGHASYCRLLARLLFAPLSQEELDGLRRTGLGSCLPESAQTEAERTFAEGLGLIAGGLASGGDLRLALNVDYTGAFYGVNQYEGKVATPYESVFRDEGHELYGESRHEVFSAYKRDALRLREGIDLPEDHISFELQYAAILEDRARGALEAGDREEAARLAGKSAEFIRGHILSWIDGLYAVADKLLELDFYRGVLKATKGFLQIVCEDLDALATQFCCPEQTTGR